MFHLRPFLGYHLNRKFEDHSLVFEQHGNIRCVFPAAVVQDDGQKILFSHPGASFGGFVYQHLTYSEADEIAAGFQQYLKLHGFDKAFYVPTPDCYFTAPDQTLEYALLWRGHEVIENYISSIIELDRSADDIIRQICRNKNRTPGYYEKLKKKHQIRLIWKNDFETFYPILTENKARHDALPTHSLDELYHIDELLPGRLKLLLMFAGSEPVGGTLAFQANSRNLILFYNMISYAHSGLQPATMQIMETINKAKTAGFDRLDFGVSQDPKSGDPLTPSPKLIRFKEELTGRGMIRRAFEYKVI